MFKNKILKNASWLIFCRVIQSVLALFISMLTARYLGASNFGVINYAASVVAFFSPIANLGLNSILVKELVRRPEKEGEILGTAMIMSVASSIVCILGISSFAMIAHNNEKTTALVCILYSLMLICYAFEIMQYWFQAKYMSKYFAVSSLIAYVGVAIYKIFLLILQKEIYWFALSNSLDYLIISMLMLAIYKKKGGQRLSFSIDTAKLLFREGKYYILSALMVTIFAQTDRIMLKFVEGDATVGYYSAAFACANLFNFVFVAIIDSMRPTIFESQKDGKAPFEKNMSKLYCVVIYLSLAQSVGMTVLAKLIVHILYGIDYYAAIGILQLIVWYTTFAFIGTIRDIWLVSQGLQKYLWVINVSGALMNIALNCVFITFWGAYGAAFASVLTQIFTNVLMSCIIKPLRRCNVLMLKGFNIKRVFSK